MMNLLIVNPTSNKLLDDKIYDRAIYSAKITARNSEDHTNISVINIAGAPKVFATAEDAANLPELILEALKPIADVYDGIVIAHSSDVGVDFLKNALDKTFIGTGFSGIYTALPLGKKIGILVNEKETAIIQEMVDKYKKSFSFDAKLFPVDVNTDNEAVILSNIKHQLEKMQASYAVDVFVIGDINISFAMKQLFDLYNIPVIDGVMSSVSMIENIVFNKKWLEA